MFYFAFWATEPPELDTVYRPDSLNSWELQMHTLLAYSITIQRVRYYSMTTCNTMTTCNVLQYNYSLLSFHMVWNVRTHQHTCTFKHTVCSCSMFTHIHTTLTHAVVPYLKLKTWFSLCNTWPPVLTKMVNCILNMCSPTQTLQTQTHFRIHFYISIFVSHTHTPTLTSLSLLLPFHWQAGHTHIFWKCSHETWISKGGKTRYRHTDINHMPTHTHYSLS